MSTHPLDRTYFSPYFSTEEACRKVRGINAAFRTLCTENSINHVNKILSEYGWKISDSQLNSVRKVCGLTKNAKIPDWEKTKFQLLVRHRAEKSNSRNWCVWVEWHWLNEDHHSQAWVRWTFWTRWNAAYAPCDLLP